MKIRNTAHATRRTRHLYDEEVMGDAYDPPGIKFSRENGIARVKKDVGPALVEKYPHFELVEDDDESSPSADGDASPDADDETETTE